MQLLMRFWRWFNSEAVVEPRVSDEWLLDNRRRACGVGVEQSRSTWPWPMEDR